MSTYPKLVSVESPYRAESLEGLVKNLEYASSCIKHSIMQGEAPFASHTFYTTYLDDSSPPQRALGMRLGDSWRLKCDLLAFYTDLGMSPGMVHALELARYHNIPVEFRTLLQSQNNA